MKPVDEQYLVSPITGEKVPASKVQEHMRIGLLDPRWVEERDKQITARAVEDQVYAPGEYFNVLINEKVHSTNVLLLQLQVNPSKIL